MIHRQCEERTKKSDQGWPGAALRSLDDAVARTQSVAGLFDHEPSDVLWELIPRNDAPPTSNGSLSGSEWDLFISHASEDKHEFVRPLAEALQKRGLSVWFDELTLTVGDSLRRSIDRGLSHSRFGVVVISPSFLKKEWAQKELDGLIAREVDGTKVILPVWHKITAREVRSYSPLLADRLAAFSSSGLHQVADELALVIDSATSLGSTAQSRHSARSHK